MADDWVIESLVFSGHALRQMFERQIAPHEVRKVVTGGEVIADYPDDKPFPSRLFLGYRGGRALHVVLAYNKMSGTGYVVTAYVPDPALWSSDFKLRRRQ